MRRVVFVLFFVFASIGMHCEEDAELNMHSILKTYYIIPECGSMGQNYLILNADSTFSYLDVDLSIPGLARKNDGRWWLQSDSLFLLLSYVIEPKYRHLPKLPDELEIERRNIELMQSNVVNSKFRHFLDENSDVNVLRVFDFGDSIVSLISNDTPLCYFDGMKGYNMASTFPAAMDTIGEWRRPYIPWGIWKKPDIPYWRLEKFDKSNTFEIKYIDEYEGQPYIVCVSAYSINYMIVNPKLYLSDRQKLRYGVEYVEQLSSWMKNVNVNEKCELTLLRPPGYDKMERCKYERGDDDSVYTMLGEAYGYWFARPLSSK